MSRQDPPGRGLPKTHIAKATRPRLPSVVLVAVILGVYSRLFVLQVTKIPSRSMEPTLLVGDHVLVNRFLYGAEVWGEPSPKWLPMAPVSRGDVVVFHRPRGEQTIKRCMGRPGDTVWMKAGELSVNGVSGDAPSIRTDHSDFGPSTLPLDRYFFLGDHRAKSIDSRFWGAVTRQRLSGRAFLVYWSFLPKTDVAASSNWGKMRTILDRALGWPARTRWHRCLKPVR